MRGFDLGVTSGVRRSLDPRERSRGRYVAGHWTHARLSKRPSGARRHGTERGCRCITEIGDGPHQYSFASMSHAIVSPFTSAMWTRAPLAAKAWVIARPMPLPPAVIGTRPRSFILGPLLIESSYEAPDSLTRSVRRPKGHVSKRMNPNLLPSSGTRSQMTMYPINAISLPNMPRSGRASAFPARHQGGGGLSHNMIADRPHGHPTDSTQTA
jgi:hypothetical protein